MEYIDSKEAMKLLCIKSPTTFRDYEQQGKIKAYRPFSNRKRYKVAELLKALQKG